MCDDTAIGCSGRPVITQARVCATAPLKNQPLYRQEDECPFRVGRAGWRVLKAAGDQEYSDIRLLTASRRLSDLRPKTATRIHFR
jgi:hypothetical protein